MNYCCLCHRDFSGPAEQIPGGDRCPDCGEAVRARLAAGPTPAPEPERPPEPAYVHIPCETLPPRPLRGWQAPEPICADTSNRGREPGCWQNLAGDWLFRRTVQASCGHLVPVDVYTQAGLEREAAFYARQRCGDCDCSDPAFAPAVAARTKRLFRE